MVVEAARASPRTATEPEDPEVLLTEKRRTGSDVMELVKRRASVGELVQAFEVQSPGIDPGVEADRTLPVGQLVQRFESKSARLGPAHDGSPRSAGKGEEKKAQQTALPLLEVLQRSRKEEQHIDREAFARYLGRTAAGLAQPANEPVLPSRSLPNIRARKYTEKEQAKEPEMEEHALVPVKAAPAGRGAPCQQGECGDLLPLKLGGRGAEAAGCTGMGPCIPVPLYRIQVREGVVCAALVFHDPLGVVERGHSALARLGQGLRESGGRTRDAATALRKGAGGVMGNPALQFVAVGAAGGAAAGGTTGATVGAVAGGSLGALLALPVALPTLGLSVPLGAAIGTSAGLCAGGVAGSVAGTAGGGLVGYVGYRCRGWAGTVLGHFTMAQASHSKEG